MSLQSVITNNN